MPTNTEKVFKYAAELHDRKYPFALNLFNPMSLGIIFHGFSEKGRDYTPSFAVIERMIPFDLSYEIPDRETLQGYVDVVGLYAGAGEAKANNTPIFYESIYNFFGHLDKLPDEIRTGFQRFLYENDRWALGAMTNKDLADGRDFMAKLVRELEREGKSQLYLRGAKTARDTFSLYVEVCQEFLRGKFRA